MTTWTIHTYGTGDYLRFVFNGVAAIMGEDNYFVLLKTSAIVGLLSILITSAFKQGRSNYTSVLMVMAFYMAVVIPKVNIEIKDEIVPGNSAIVSNIPVGLGVPAAAFSKLGFWLTKGFETVFSLPHQIKYSGNGLLFAQKLVEESTRFVITDPRLSSNFSEFWKGCVYYDLFLGLYTWTEILKSDDLSSFISQKTSQTRGFTYENHDGSRSIVTCRVAYNDLLMKDLENEIKMAQRIHGMRIVPNKKTVNDTIAEFSTSMPIAYQYLTGISKSNSQIMSQNILANSFRRGFMNFASNVDASAAAEDFALAKAEASRKTTFNTLGKIAKKHLPELQGIFEAFIYSIFTIVVMLAMLPVTTKVFSYYTFALMWINLWPPLYAIINFCINYFSQKASTAVVAQSGQAFSTGISLMTSTGLGNVLSDYAAVAGYFSLSIPMISFMILNKSGGMMASMASRLMEGYDGPVSKAAEDSTSGNIQLGQMSYDNQTAFQANEAPSYNSGYTKNTDHDGFSTTSTSNGEYINAPMSSTPANVSWSEMTSNTLSKQQSEAEQLAATSSSDTLNSLGIAQNEINSKINSLNENRSNSNSWSENDSKSLSEITNESERIVNDVSKRIGHTYSDVDNLMGEISGMASVSGGLKVPLTNTGAELRAQLSARYNKSYNWISDENLNKVHNAMTSSEYISAMRDEANTINNLMAKYDKSFLESESKNLNNTVNNLESASMRKSEAFSKLSNISNITSNIKSFQSAISIKGDDGFMSWLSDKGFSNNDIKTLYSNVNKGNIGAKKAFNDQAQEYIKSYTDNFNSNDLKILKNDIEKNYESNRNNLSKKAIHKDIIDNTGYNELVDRIKSKHGSFPNILETKNAITNERNILNKEISDKL